MSDVVFAIDGVQFMVRVAGVCIEDDHVLLNRFTDRSFWFLPGGRCAIQEASRDTLFREMQEELGVTVQVGRLLWVNENFFSLDGLAYHEIGLYYLMTLPPGSERSDTQHVFRTVADLGEDAVFQWFPLNALDSMEVQPAFLAEGLRALPQQTQHLIQRG